MAVIFCGLGLSIAASGLQASIKVATSGGTVYCPILFWEKAKAALLVKELNKLIAEAS
jgi:hypothetical protein